jgi:pimeloyl-ACP methyl ester carboxylesterase
MRLATALACLSLVCACSSDEEDVVEAPPDRPSYAYPVEQASTSWASCSLYEGEDDGLAECATVAMPLFWDDPNDGQTFSVRAKRKLSSEQAEAQLWLLAGGPGQSGTWDMPRTMEVLQERYPTLDVYTLDHRGTGLSGRLGCPDAESFASPSGTSINRAETAECAEYLLAERGHELDAITTTQSAVDVAALIEATREEGKRVFLSGGSYGTYWVQRYLQIFPDQADGVVLAGIFPADGTVIWYDEHTNAVAHQFLDLCGQDDVCSSKLGADPWSRLGSLLDSMAAGHCTGGGITPSLVRTLFAYLLYWSRTNVVVPAAIYRLERCDSEDRQAIVNLTSYLFGDGGSFDLESYSILLQHHIQLSEMWNHPDFDGVALDSYFDEIDQQAYVAKSLGPFKLELHETWPIYLDQTWDDGWGESSIPMLMLQGRLDPATVRREAVRVGEHYTGEHQHYVEFPTAAHGTLGHTPTVDGRDCGYDLLVAFLEDPTGPLDTACVERVVPIDFRGTETLAQAVFGTPHLWSNAARRTKPEPRSASSEARALRQLLRSRLRSYTPLDTR